MNELFNMAGLNLPTYLKGNDMETPEVPQSNLNKPIEIKDKETES